MTATASAMDTVHGALREDIRSNLRSPVAYLPANTLGIASQTLLPSLGVHGGLSLIAYGIARSTNRVDLKDWLWPTGFVINAWWTAVGRHSLSGPRLPATQVCRSLNFSQQALLGAVTAWGGRLLYRIVKRSIQRGKDDPRYEGVKEQNNAFWNKAVLLFGLEAVFQSIIALPFTSAFQTDIFSNFSVAPREWASAVRLGGAGLFAAGLFLETIADWQLDSHKEREKVKKEQGESGQLLREGVWSIVRHPNYLGDLLVHASFPLWTYGCGLFSLAQILGPVANYVFLRWIGGDRENEAYQIDRYAKEDRDKFSQLELYQLQKHSFWPSLFEVVNPWTWVVASVGAAGAAAEYFAESRLGAVMLSANPINPVIGEELAGLA